MEICKHISDLLDLLMIKCLYFNISFIYRQYLQTGELRSEQMEKYIKLFC